ncbi:MAG: helix-turn-helix domain-containing protein [Clostridiales bacterium]|nr:helix-turn-helix domain-containing protein [Clostridiales bacterium]
MEAKTIGKFIAVLRKANGMTQKELAEKLNVSDKAVSRWERDESLPDLTLIPVIAELFGVTADELLRGERNPAGEAAEPARPSARTEKQIAHILEEGKNRLMAQSMLPVGLCLAGLLGAMVANFGFNRAYIGFFVGCLFYVAAILCQATFCILAYGKVKGEEFEGEGLNDYKRYVLFTLRVGVGLAVVLFGATLPLFLLTEHTYVGLLRTTWLAYGLLGGAIAALIWGILCVAISKVAEKRRFYVPTEREKTRDALRWKARRKVWGVTLLVMAVTLLGQVVFNLGVTDRDLMEGTVFTDVDSFQTYMGTAAEDGDEEITEAGSVLYDEDGNELASREPAAGDDESDYDVYANFTGPDGTPLEYVWRNTDVWQIACSGEGDNWQVIVFTEEDFAQASSIRSTVNTIWLVGYIAELAAGILWYRHELKKKKLK